MCAEKSIPPSGDFRKEKYMANRVIKGLVKKTGLGAAIGAATSVAGNAMGGVDPGMNHYAALAAAESFHPSNPLLVAGVGAAVGLGVGIHQRNQEIKRNKNLGRQFD